MDALKFKNIWHLAKCTVPLNLFTSNSYKSLLSLILWEPPALDVNLDVFIFYRLLGKCSTTTRVVGFLHINFECCFVDLKYARKGHWLNHKCLSPNQGSLWLLIWWPCGSLMLFTARPRYEGDVSCWRLVLITNDCVFMTLEAMI